MALRIRYEGDQGAFGAAIREMYSPIAIAGSAAIAEASSAIKAEGRAEIGRAGFSQRWKNTFRALEFPRGGKVSANAAALIFHKIPYAEIFESGGTIRGKPMLWLPISTPGKRIPSIRRTPERFRKSIGPMTFVQRPGKPPLLVAPAMLGPAQAKKKRPEPSVRALKRGAARSQGARGPRSVLRGVPVFVGKESVDIPKKFALLKIVDRHAGRLAALYVKHLEVE